MSKYWNQEHKRYEISMLYLQRINIWNKNTNSELISLESDYKFPLILRQTYAVYNVVGVWKLYVVTVKIARFSSKNYVKFI